MNISIITDQVNQDFDLACELISLKGIQWIDIHHAFNKTIEQCTLEEIHEVKAIAKKHGVKIANLASTVFFLCPLKPHTRVSLFNPAFYCIEGGLQAHLDALRRVCHYAQILEAKSVRVFPFRFPDNEEIQIVGTEEDLILISDALRSACDIASEFDVMLVLENCPYSYCPKGEMTYELVKRVNHKSLMLLWDPANSYRALKEKVPQQYLSLNLIEEYQLIHDQIGHVHLKNYSYKEGLPKPFVHRALLEGDINMPQLLEQLNTLNLIVSLEPEVDYEETIKSMDSLINWHQFNKIKEDEEEKQCIQLN